jgi:hypothetical protein
MYLFVAITLSHLHLFADKNDGISAIDERKCQKAVKQLKLPFARDETAECENFVLLPELYL